MTLDEEGRAIQVLGLQVSDRGIYAAAELEDGTLMVTSFDRRENIMTGEVSVEQTTAELPGFDGRARQILIDNRFRHLYVADDAGYIHHYDIGNLRAPSTVGRCRSPTAAMSPIWPCSMVRYRSLPVPQMARCVSISRSGMTRTVTT